MLLVGANSFALGVGSGIYINGLEVSQAELDTLEHRHGIRVADVRLSRQQIYAIQQIYGVSVDGRRFWYDSISGAWGYEGLPAAGKTLPNLQVTAPISAYASGGGTDVIVNGRILHPTEVQYLIQRFGSVTPGRYFLLPDGSYGFEDGPVLGKLGASQYRSTRTGHDHSGTVIGADEFVSYIPPRVGGGVGVSCAPDGGCIYSSRD